MGGHERRSRECVGPDRRRPGKVADNNLVETESYVYDGGNAGGDGLLTSLTDHVGDAPNRVTNYLYNAQDELAYVVLPADAAGNVDYGFYAYDNLGDTTSTQAWLVRVPAPCSPGARVPCWPPSTAGRPITRCPLTGNGGDLLLSQTDSAYDSLGQNYRDHRLRGHYPEYQGEPFKDLGADGIPLWWKKKYKLDANDPALAGKDLQGDGYTVIEKYLNGLDPTKKIDWSNPRSNENTLTANNFKR